MLQHFLSGHKDQPAPLLSQEAVAYWSGELSHEELLQLCGGARPQHLHHCVTRQLRQSREKGFAAGGEERTKDCVVQPEGPEQAEERFLPKSCESAELWCCHAESINHFAHLTDLYPARLSYTNLSIS